MALIKPTPPQQVRQALLTGVNEFMDRNDPLRNVLMQSPLALHVFTLRLNNVAVGPSAATSAGWRFLATDVSSGMSVAGDVIEGNQGGPPRMTSLSRDPLIGRAIRAVNEVETFSEVQNDHYELLVLRIPGVLTEAFWLKSLTGGPDLMVPVLTKSQELERMKVYQLDQFLGIVQSLVPGFLEFDKPSTSKYPQQQRKQ